MSGCGTQAAADVAGQLEQVANELRGIGFAASVTRTGGRRCVGVVNDAATGVSEVVYAAPAADGSWWFWWPWNDRIAPIDDLATAAFKIAYVLTPCP